MKIELNTEDDVYLDFNNTADLENNLSNGNYDYYQDDDAYPKSYTFSIVKNGDYSFETIVLDSKTSKQLASKTIKETIEGLSETSETKNNYDTETIADVDGKTLTNHDPKYSTTLTVEFGDHSGVDLGYYYWLENSDCSNATINKVDENATSITIANCLSGNKMEGYLIFFVEPKEGKMFTGINAGQNSQQGGGQIWLIKQDGEINTQDYKPANSENDGISYYPNLVKVISSARTNGYSTCFGWSKNGNIDNNKITFTTTAVEPSMDISVTAKDNNKNLVPGQKASLTISIKPTIYNTGTVIKNNVTEIKITKVNDVELKEAYTLHDTNNNNTYTCDAYYTITEEDYKSGKVSFTATGTVTYESKTTASSGTIARNFTVSKDDTAEIDPFNYFDTSSVLVTYEFQKADGTTKDDLPDSVTKLLTTKYEMIADSDANFKNFTPKVTTFDRVTNGNNAWIFQGWDPISKNLSEVKSTNSAGTKTFNFVGKWAYLNTTLKFGNVDNNEFKKVYDGSKLEPKITYTFDSQNNTRAANGDGVTLTYSTYNEQTKSWSEYTSTVPSITNFSESGLKFRVKAEKDGYETKISDEYTLTITPAPVTVAAKNATKVYGKDDPEFSADVTGLVNNESTDLIKYTFKRDPGENVNDNGYTITPEGNVNQGNYAVTYTTAKLTITQSNEMTIVTELTDSSLIKLYDGKELKGGAVANQKDTKIEYSINNGATWSEAVPSITDAGSLNVIAKTVNNNYAEKRVEYTLTVTKRSVTFTGKSDALIHTGNELKVEGVTISGDGLVSGSTHNVVAIASGKNLGDHAGSITDKNSVVIKDSDGNDVTKNYNINTVAGSLKIYLEQIVTCEQAMNSKNWTWSEAKQACVYKVSNTAAE